MGAGEDGVPVLTPPQPVMSETAANRAYSSSAPRMRETVLMNVGPFVHLWRTPISTARLMMRARSGGWVARALMVGVAGFKGVVLRTTKAKQRRSNPALTSYWIFTRASSFLMVLYAQAMRGVL